MRYIGADNGFPRGKLEKRLPEDISHLLSLDENMEVKQAMIFLKVYDLSYAKPNDLVEFFDTQEQCFIAGINKRLERNNNDLLKTIYELLMTVPPQVSVLFEKFRELVLPLINENEPLKSAERIVAYHPLPDGNKRLALLVLAVLKYFREDWFPSCSEYAEILRRVFG